VNKLSKKADEIVKELKKLNWEDIYDKENLMIQKVLPAPKDRDKHYYMHEWTIKQTVKDSKVLDVGCGDGALCYLLKKQGRVPFGVDVSKESIKGAKNNVPGVMFKQMYAEKLEFGDNSFDYVCSNQMLEHLKEPEEVIKEMIRVARYKVIITVPIGTNLNCNGRSKHLHFWDYYQLMHIFEKYGDKFKIHWLNKFKKYDDEGDINKKNIFGVVFEVK
jgi:ubiquinone/menaquinone biosynthesis C-methylase UbiE